tara:strand:- start:4623 stop:5312 length:690 start_codon:yes stop_codon:yes gene_type:complete
MNKKEPLVSVIVSAYNAEETIEDSIKSIILQKYKNIEIHVVNDGSEDDTEKILDGLKKENNIYVYKNKINLGLTKSLNFLINQTKGSLIARHDADDISLPNRIEKQVEHMEKFNLDFCSSRAYIMGTKRNIPNLSYYLPKKFVLRFKNPFIHGTLIIKKETLLEHGLYDENFYYAQDYKLMIDLLDSGCKYKFIKENLYELNYFNNISINFKEEQKYYAKCARKRIIPS